MFDYLIPPPDQHSALSSEAAAPESPAPESAGANAQRPTIPAETDPPTERERAGDSQVEAPIDPDLARLPLELIEREIESLAAQVNAGHARWLALVAEFDRRNGWWDSGCRSLSEWVAWRCALNPRSAREHVRVARALPGLPLVRAAFGRGELSYSKVRALTRVADAESEEELLRLARYATAAQLERMVRAARRVIASEANDLHESAYLRWHWDDRDGSLRIEARLAPEDGAVFLRALEAARDRLHAQRVAERDQADEERAEAHERRPEVRRSAGGGSAEPSLSPYSPSNAESFAALCEAALARPPDGGVGRDPSPAERYHVLLHVDAQTLATDSPGASLTGPGACAIADGPALAPETARRLACDASVTALTERDGELLSVGRRTRSVPPALRRALLARDGRCQFPGCERSRFVDAHHIQHWAGGGETSLSNLVLLCRHHHRLVHESGYVVDRSPEVGRLRFADARGEAIASSPAPPRASPQELVAANRARGLDIDHETTLTGDGEPARLVDCVDAVLCAVGVL